MFGMNSRKWASLFTRSPLLCLLFLAATSVPCIQIARHLELQSDFRFLLPQNRPSVVEMNRLIEKVGGVGNLIVAVECEDAKATERFLEDLAVRLRRLPSGYIRYVEYNITESKKFYEDNRFLYMDLEDLQKIYERLDRKIRYEKLRNNPLYFSLDDQKVEFNVDDIEAKYKNRDSSSDYYDGYFFSKDRKLAAFVIKPYGVSTGTAFAKDLIGWVQEGVNDLHPARYHPSMKINYMGKFKDTLDEYDQLRIDTLETLGLCLLLVAVAIFLYFKRIRMVWLPTVPLFLGVAWTFALTALHIGHLNSQTVFLGSIIVGNGVNSGIILMARYLEERRKRSSVENALAVTIDTTWLGTFTAALTTSCSFATLAFATTKGFSEFGFIGGVGMMLCWLATYACLPPLLVLSERIAPIVEEKQDKAQPWGFFLRSLGRVVTRSGFAVRVLGLFLILVSLFAYSQFVRNSMEYNFAKLRNRPQAHEGEKTLAGRVDDIFKQDLSPVVILLQDKAQAPYICDAVMRMESGESESAKTIDTCKTLNSYLPERQEEKLLMIRKVHRLVADRSLNFIDSDFQKNLKDLRSQTDRKALSISDLPVAIKRNFQELDNRLGRIAYVFPRRSTDLSNGKNLIHFADMLSHLRLSDGSVARMSGEAAIFADLLRAIKHDGPLATIASFLIVSLIVILGYRNLTSIIYIVGGLIAGIIFLFGLQAALEIKLNFFNFIALPVTFGIGVEYGVNFWQRYRLEGAGSIPKVLESVGGAIILCSLTTIVGYATLTTARNQALASFGWLGLLGEVACLFAALFMMPAVLQFLEMREGRQSSRR